MTDLWQLSPREEPGNHILPVLQSALLQRQGGSVELGPGRDAASFSRQEIEDLEKVLGDNRFVRLHWYRTGLQRCEAVARIETKWGEGFGSGFLVRGDDLHPVFAGMCLLLTNAHVISDDPAEQSASPPAIAPHRARVRFEARQIDGTPQTYDIKSLLWTSPRDKLDATQLELESPLTCDVPYPLAVALPSANQDRVCVIGHPWGEGLSLSIQDNRVIDVKRPKIHYRAPTEPGSAGSPVFNQDWELVAIHHAGSRTMPTLSGEGTYDAKEGILIMDIVEAIQRFLG